MRLPPVDSVIISGAVEGLVDEAVLRRLVREAGAVVGPVYGKSGKADLLKKTAGYNLAARLGPWIVLVDLDRHADCAPPALGDWLPQPEPLMCFRVVVREIEAWLMADRERLARFLGVSLLRIPAKPEEIDSPKELLVALANSSRRRYIKEDMVPRPGSGRIVGPAYNSRLIEFVQDLEHGWRPDVAALNSDSLARCQMHLLRLVKEAT